MDVAAFDRTTTDRAGAEDPPWLAARRASAAERFAGLDMPSSREEAWRYLDLDFAFDDFAVADPGNQPLPADALLDVGPVTAAMRIVDGRPLDGLAEGDGYALAPLAAAAIDQEAAVRSALDRLPEASDRFSAAHDAFGGDGAFLRVDKGAVVRDPFFVDVQGTASGVAHFPRTMVVAEEGAEASIVLHYRSPEAFKQLAVPHLVIAAGPAAQVSVTIVQNWGYETRAIGRAYAVVDRDATVRFAEASLGGRLSRLRLDVDLEGRGSEAKVLGAYFGDAHQTMDYRYFIRHVGQNTRSDMFLKGAVEDEALSVFTGLIRIEEDAQKTEAFQTNRNLILSSSAAAQSVPNLEILANDVKCGHGSTVGPLDDEQRYYLMSRGLPRERADRLQVRGFFEQVLARFPTPTVIGPVREWVNDKYVRAQQAGRV
jgi:Fe-S cluster assembly protein SufD